MKRSSISTALAALCALSAACSTSSDDDTGLSVPDAGEPDLGVPDAGDVDAGGGMDVDPNACPQRFEVQGTPTCAPLGAELDPGTAPIRRGDMAVAHDPACDRMFMFFGDRAEPQMCGPAASTYINDGYTFEPTTGKWAAIEFAGGAAPRERVRSAAVWDAMRNRVIVFGGRWRQGTVGAYTYYNDVWAFDPATKGWTELSTNGRAGAPTQRMNTVMIADPDGDRLIVFGGGRVSTDGMSFIVEAGTYAFNFASNTWTTIATNGTPPIARLFHVGALDRPNRKLYIWGGGGADAFTATSFMRDMWTLDLATNTWAQVPVSNPQPRGRIKAEMDYDATRNQLVLFAGHDDGSLGNDNDIWTWDLSNGGWTNRTIGDTFNAPPLGFCDFPADFAIVDECHPERRESHMFRIFGDRAYMYGGRTDCGLANDTWILDLRDYKWKQVSDSFNGMTCHRSGRTDCDEPTARKCG